MAGESPAARVRRAATALAAGGLVVVVDGADRENEADLLGAAELMTRGTDDFPGAPYERNRLCANEWRALRRTATAPDIGIAVTRLDDDTVHYELGLFDNEVCLGTVDTAAPRDKLSASALMN